MVECDGALGGDRWKRRKEFGGIDQDSKATMPVGCAFDASGRPSRFVGGAAVVVRQVIRRVVPHAARSTGVERKWWIPRGCWRTAALAASPHVYAKC